MQSEGSMVGSTAELSIFGFASRISVLSTPPGKLTRTWQYQQA